ncbi:MAG: CoA transferase [Actinomycetota bacterium]
MASSVDPRIDGLLAGVKVVEFAQNAAVPQCGRLLAGMGADVVKVEPPAGDAMRHLAAIAPNESRAYATINPGKRAICLDLTDPTAPEIVERLISWADILLVGLKRADFERYGLDWESVQRINPAVVSLEFTAFGPVGPDADRGGYDQLVQGASGLGWSMNRSVDDVPLPTRPAAIDFGSGGYAAAAVMAALRHAEKTGQGQRVDASLLGTAMSLGTPILSAFDHDADRLVELREEMTALRDAGTGFDDQRGHYDQRVVAFGGLFRLYVRPFQTADGVISIAGYSPALMAKFHELTGLDPVPTGVADSDPSIRAVIDAAEELFASRSSADWLADLTAIGYPCSPYNTPYEAIETEQVEANRYVVDLEHAVYGGYRTVGMPFSFSDAPVAVDRPAPSLGEHTAEVLGELGFSPNEIARHL